MNWIRHAGFLRTFLGSIVPHPRWGSTICWCTRKQKRRVDLPLARMLLRVTASIQLLTLRLRTFKGFCKSSGSLRCMLQFIFSRVSPDNIQSDAVKYPLGKKPQKVCKRDLLTIPSFSSHCASRHRHRGRALRHLLAKLHSRGSTVLYYAV